MCRPPARYLVAPDSVGNSQRKTRALEHTSDICSQQFQPYDVFFLYLLPTRWCQPWRAPFFPHAETMLSASPSCPSSFVFCRHESTHRAELPQSTAGSQDSVFMSPDELFLPFAFSNAFEANPREKQRKNCPSLEQLRCQVDLPNFRVRPRPGASLPPKLPYLYENQKPSRFE